MSDLIRREDVMAAISKIWWYYGDTKNARAVVAALPAVPVVPIADVLKVKTELRQAQERLAALDDLARLGQEFDAAPDPAAIREAALREAAKRVTELMTREVKSAVGDGYNLGLGTAYDAILALIQKGTADDRA